MNMMDFRMFETIIVIYLAYVSMEVCNNSHVKDKMIMNWVSKVFDFAHYITKILVIRILVEICVVSCGNNIKKTVLITLIANWSDKILQHKQKKLSKDRKEWDISKPRKLIE